MVYSHIFFRKKLCVHNTWDRASSKLLRSQEYRAKCKYDVNFHTLNRKNYWNRLKVNTFAGMHFNASSTWCYELIENNINQWILLILNDIINFKDDNINNEMLLWGMKIVNIAEKIHNLLICVIHVFCNSRNIMSKSILICLNKY